MDVGRRSSALIVGAVVLVISWLATGAVGGAVEAPSDAGAGPPAIGEAIEPEVPAPPAPPVVEEPAAAQTTTRSMTLAVTRAEEGAVDPGPSLSPAPEAVPAPFQAAAPVAPGPPARAGESAGPESPAPPVPMPPALETPPPPPSAPAVAQQPSPPPGARETAPSTRTGHVAGPRRERRAAVSARTVGVRSTPGRRAASPPVRSARPTSSPVRTRGARVAHHRHGRHVVPPAASPAQREVTRTGSNVSDVAAGGPLARLVAYLGAGADPVVAGPLPLPVVAADRVAVASTPPDDRGRPIPVDASPVAAGHPCTHQRPG